MGKSFELDPYLKLCKFESGDIYTSLKFENIYEPPDYDWLEESAQYLYETGNTTDESDKPYDEIKRQLRLS